MPYQWQLVRDIVARAYKQLPKGMPTLLILCDDLKFPLSMTPDWVEEAPHRRRTPGFTDWLGEDGPFVDRRFENLGALATLNVEWGLYFFNLFPNPNALRAVQLPDDIFARFPIWKGERWE
jgi:hypothetical protein